MTEKMIISYDEQLKLQSDIIRQMTTDHFLPDVIIGVSRGGLPIGVMMSHYYDTKFIPFKGSLRDHPNWETDWKLPSHWTIKNGKRRILIVDDICDEGDTLKKITADIGKASITVNNTTPDQYKYGAHMWLITHAKKVCTSRKPGCNTCDVEPVCAKRNINTPKSKLREAIR